LSFECLIFISRKINMEHQAWEPVVLRRGAPKNQNEAAARGMLEKRLRVPNAATSQHARALEENEAPKAPKKVLPESRTELVKARLARGFTQEQADAACALPKHTFKGIESGQLTPNSQILSKISREMKINLKLA
jgi:ribosome-binding protein aMBF1 (putative translation factor)